VTFNFVERENWTLVVIEHATELSPDEVLRAAQLGVAPAGLTGL